MTTVYKLHKPFLPTGNMKYASLTCASLDIVQALQLSAESFNKYQNQPLGENWPKYEIKYYDTKGKPKADFYVLPGYLLLAMSPKAVEVMEDLLLPFGEFLPLSGKNKENLIVYRLYTESDVLDIDKCELVYSDTYPNMIWKIYQYYFIEERVQTIPIFVAKGSATLFVTDVFLKRYQEANLKGLGFLAMWSSEKGTLSSGRISFDISPTELDLNL